MSGTPKQLPLLENKFSPMATHVFTIIDRCTTLETAYVDSVDPISAFTPHLSKEAIADFDKALKTLDWVAIYTPRTTAVEKPGHKSLFAVGYKDGQYYGYNALGNDVVHAAAVLRTVAAEYLTPWTLREKGRWALCFASIPILLALGLSVSIKNALLPVTVLFCIAPLILYASRERWRSGAVAVSGALNKLTPR